RACPVSNRPEPSSYRSPLGLPSPAPPDLPDQQTMRFLTGGVDVSSRERLGWNPFFAAQVAQLGRTDLGFARVIEEQRGMYRVAGDAEGVAEVSGRFRHEHATAAGFPAVGDWVGVRDGIIQCRLERRSSLSRAAPGRGRQEQGGAAHIDHVLLLNALAGE